MEEFKECVSSVLRSLRAEKGYTQLKTAELSGVDAMTIGRYENNPNTIVLDKLDNIVQAYGINCYIFFDLVNAKMHKEQMLNEEK